MESFLVFHRPSAGYAAVLPVLQWPDGHGRHHRFLGGQVLPEAWQLRPSDLHNASFSPPRLRFPSGFLLADLFPAAPDHHAFSGNLLDSGWQVPQRQGDTFPVQPVQPAKCPTQLSVQRSALSCWPRTRFRAGYRVFAFHAGGAGFEWTHGNQLLSAIDQRNRDFFQ